MSSKGSDIGRLQQAFTYWRQLAIQKYYQYNIIINYQYRAQILQLLLAQITVKEHSFSMKVKPSTLFSNKFSQCLAKLRDNSTIQIGHQQFKQLLQNTQLKDILTPFISKIDTIDRPSERQKKQHSKLYISLIDHFGQQLLLQTFYQKFMQSLAKKNIGVAEVIGFFCKGYITRIHPAQNIRNYIIYMLTLFRNHNEVHKIIKQICQNIGPSITKQFQNDMVGLIIDKMTLSRQKSQHIESLMAIVLSLQDKFQCEQMIQPVLSKNLKNQDWTVRKACVDLCYAFMVVKEQINSNLNQMIKQLKYDKIKNVRDAVLNYQALFKQVYGQEQSFKPHIYSQKTVRTKQYKSPLKSPIQRQKLKTQQYDVSTYSNGKAVGKIRNQTFFKNAKDSNVIRTSEDIMNSTSIQKNRSNPFLQQDNGDYLLSDDIKKLKQNKSVILSSSPNIKTNSTKRGLKTNIMPQQLNTIKMQKQKQSPSNSPKFNNNKYEQNRNLQKNKSFEGIGGRMNSNNQFKKQVKVLLYDADDDEDFRNVKQLKTGYNKVSPVFQSQAQNQRKQYMPIKKSQLKSINQLNEQDHNLNRKLQTKIPTNLISQTNQYILPKQFSFEDQSTPSLKGFKMDQHIQNRFNNVPQRPASNQNQPNQPFNLNNKFNFNSSVQKQSLSTNAEIQMQQNIQQMFKKFSGEVISRLDRIQRRVQVLEQSYSKVTFGKESVHGKTFDRENQGGRRSAIYDLENLQDSGIQPKNNHYYNYDNNDFNKKKQLWTINNTNEGQNKKKKEKQWVFQQGDSHNYDSNQAIQVNLNQKLNRKSKQQNVDQAFTLALTNNNPFSLMKILESLAIPKDKTVQQCLFLQLKKQLHKKQTLKWLKNYLIQNQKMLKFNPQSQISRQLVKMHNQLKFSDQNKDERHQQKQYILLKTMVINQIQQVFSL